MKRRLELEYTLGEGWLLPFLDGLREGRAVASSCSACGAVHFPPLRSCANCRLPCNGWCTLNGKATILFRTDGADGDYALARFDGAMGATTARAGALPTGVSRAILAPCPHDPPMLSLIPEPET